MRNAYKILLNLKGRDHTEDQGTDGNREGFIWLTIGASGGILQTQ
jgi:hypothetical protein